MTPGLAVIAIDAAAAAIVGVSLLAVHLRVQHRTRAVARRRWG